VLAGSTQDQWVDVEDVRPIEPEVADYEFFGERAFAADQIAGDTWSAGFYRCWRRKEAILKGEGVGLFHALDSLDVLIGE
jgi:4'-phosphopantetheinyl transferase